MNKNAMPRRDFIALLSIFLYTLISYISFFWWLTPLFFLCSAAVLLLPGQLRWQPLVVWCASMALITFAPCLWMVAVWCRFTRSASILAALIVIMGTLTFVAAGAMTWLVNTKMPHHGGRLVVSAAFWTLTWWFIDQYFFWWLVPGYGYMLANPLLPLCSHAPLVSPVAYCGVYGFFFLLMMVAGGLVLWWHEAVWWGWLVGVGVVLLMVLAGVPAARAQRPLFVDHLVAVGHEGKGALLERLCALQHYCEACPTATELVVCPESYVPYALNEAEDALVVVKDVSPNLLVGAQSTDWCGRRHNSAYFLQQGRITRRYDKTTLLPFFEFKPGCHFFSEFKGLLTTKGDRVFFSPGSRSTNSPNLKLTLGGTPIRMHVCLCSDLFCGNPFAHACRPDLLVALVHDAWFFGAAMADRMLWFVQLWAVRHQMPVIYCGYRKASFIDRFGNAYHLSRISLKGLWLP